MTTDASKPSLLEQIMLENGDFGLFPQNILDAYADSERGPLVAHKLMKQVHANEPDTSRKAVLHAWLHNARVWTQWNITPPSIQTVNGLGLTAVGREDVDPDNHSFILTTYACLFNVPLLPRASYVVTEAQGGWFFHGQCPPTRRARRRGWITAAVLTGLPIVCVVIALLGAAFSDRRGQVIAYNGFDHTVQVEFGDDAYRVGPHSYQYIRHPAGPLVIRAHLEDGTAIDELAVTLAGRGHGLTVYNIGRRSIIAKSYVVYGNGAVLDDELLTTPLFDMANIDYVFTTPPASKMVDGVRDVDKALVDLTDDLTAPEWLTYLLNNDHVDFAHAFAWANVVDGPADILTVAVAASATDAQADIDRWCDKVIAYHPEAVNRHRFCQEARPDKQAVLADYTQRVADNPDSAVAHYLLGRLQESEVGDQTLARAIELDPTLGWPYMARAHTTATTTDNWSEALASLDMAVQMEPLLEEQTRDIWLRVNQLAGVTGDDLAEAWEARVPRYLQDDPLSDGNLLRLSAHPATLAIVTSRIQRALTDAPTADAALAMGGAALAAGNLPKLRQAGTDSDALKLYIALSDGATAEERLWVADAERTTFKRALLAATHELREGRDAEPHLDVLETYDGDVVQLLSSPSEDVEAITATVRSLPTEWQSTVWFSLYRLTDNPVFRANALAWALPYELPILND